MVGRYNYVATPKMLKTAARILRVRFHHIFYNAKFRHDEKIVIAYLVSASKNNPQMLFSLSHKQSQPLKHCY